MNEYWRGLQSDLFWCRTSDSDAPVFIKGLSIALQPLRFMEFSMVDTLQSVVFCNEGAVIVNIPKPDRFAIHKLIVSSERKDSETVKSNKDIRQANVLIQYYIDHRASELDAVCKEAASNGPGWKKRLTEGIGRLASINPQAAGFLKDSVAGAGAGKPKAPRP